MLSKQSMAGVVALLLASAGSATALAAAADYTFEPMQAELPAGAAREIAIRLINKAPGERVSGAVIFRVRLDMSPDNMGSMTEQVTPVVATEPGVYRFRADLSMAGRWALKLMAKVQGER